MDDYSYSIMNSSISIGESGARPHSEWDNGIPVDSKILMCVSSIQLTECYIINSIRSSTTNIVCFYICRL